jgi:hypothetical protein
MSIVVLNQEETMDTQLTRAARVQLARSVRRRFDIRIVITWGICAPSSAGSRSGERCRAAADLRNGRRLPKMSAVRRVILMTSVLISPE